MEKPSREGLGLSVCYLLLKYTKLSKTQLHVGEKFDLVWMVDCGRVLHGFGGLTRIQRGARRCGRSTSHPSQTARRMGHPSTWWQIEGGVSGESSRPNRQE